MTVEQLKLLKLATNSALEEIKREQIVHGAINWANLHCVGVLWILDHDGFHSARVVIAEAAPDCVGLHQAVAAKLHERGFSGVEVVTEW